MPRFHSHYTATSSLYTLSLHDALPISSLRARRRSPGGPEQPPGGPASQHLSGSPLLVSAKWCSKDLRISGRERSEEHTSELQSLTNLVCRLLLEKKKNKKIKVLAVTKR